MQKRSRGKAKPEKKTAARGKARGEGRLRKLARTVDQALKDADAARKNAFDPEFKKGLGKDRRSTLSRFRTVRQAIAERDAIEKANEGKPKA
jgi:hypothetical protein